MAHLCHPAAAVAGKECAGCEPLRALGCTDGNAPTIDIARNQLYVGTGESYLSPASDTSDSVIAMDLTSGRVRWVYQGLAGDAYNTACIAGDQTICPEENGPDYDISASVILARDADGREVLVAGQKSGVVHALDPGTGRLLWRVKPGRGGLLGGIHFGMAAGGKVYGPSMTRPWPENRRACAAWNSCARPAPWRYRVAGARTGGHLR